MNANINAHPRMQAENLKINSKIMARPRLTILISPHASTRVRRDECQHKHTSPDQRQDEWLDDGSQSSDPHHRKIIPTFG